CRRRRDDGGLSAAFAASVDYEQSLAVRRHQLVAFPDYLLTHGMMPWPLASFAISRKHARRLKRRRPGGDPVTTRGFRPPGNAPRTTSSSSKARAKPAGPPACW